MTDLAISCKNLTIGYGDEPVIENISFDVPKGDYVGVLGPNGSGKSTLLKVLLGLLPADSGTVSVFGEDAQAFQTHHRVGYVPQKASQIEWRFPASVLEIVLSGRASQRGVLRRYSSEDRAAAKRALELVELADLQGRLLNELSGGQRQRVFIARAIAAQPDLLILDEPTTAIDPAAQHQFYGFLRHLNEQGMTIIFVSHDIDVVSHETKTTLCLNRELVCHLPSQEFVSKQHMLDIYGNGDRGTHFYHGHTHKD